MWRVKVPGSVMLFGEHAVLYGRAAIVTAIDRYLTLSLKLNKKPRGGEAQQDIKIQLVSEDLLDWTGSLAQLDSIPDAFNYLKAALKLYAKRLALKPGFSGFKLTIKGHKNFSSKVGLGSSAAVTVGVVALLERLTSGTYSRFKIYKIALKAVHQVTKLASGADVAASTYGGTLLYQPKSLIRNQTQRSKPLISKIKLTKALPLKLFYVGYKTVTSEVILKVQQFFKDKPQLFKSLTYAMELVTRQAKVALQQGDWLKLGQLMLVHQGLQYSLSTSDKHLEALISYLNASSSVFGAKISGSGLGDCVWALSKAPITLPLDLGIEVPVSVSARGINYF